MEATQASEAEQAATEERARAVGEKIRAAVDRGEFKLNSFYLGREDGRCRGCAIAAAAFTLSGLKYGGGRECRQASVASGAMTMLDAANLECGYEGWTRGMTNFAQGLAGYIGPDDPFYKLGQELRKRYRHAL